jgi:hypothetical protein
VTTVASWNSVKLAIRSCTHRFPDSGDTEWAEIWREQTEWERGRG